MPVVYQPVYTAPFWLPGGHAQTIGPRLFCFVPRLPFHRERIETPDNDFFLLDWLFVSGSANSLSAKVAILSHGLEGDSTRSYMRAMAIELNRRGWDVAARNLRFCGGPMNRLPTMYHSGETADLATTVKLCEGRGYGSIALIGFSIGGNQTLKYLGEKPGEVPGVVKAGVGVSVPCDLAGCSTVLDLPSNRIYMEYFMRTLREKIRRKHAAFPCVFSLKGLDAIKTFKAFDDAYTAPLYGFSGAEDYWAKASSAPHLGAIAVPALVLNARNDPFLSPSCFPEEIAARSSRLTLLVPEQGGHVGFPTRYGKTVGWLERTIAGFLDDAMGDVRAGEGQDSA